MPELSVLKKLETTFVVRLEEMLERKTCFKFPFYLRSSINFLQCECLRGNTALFLFKLKPVVLYEISKTGVFFRGDDVKLILSIPSMEGGFIFRENMSEGYDRAVFKLLTRAPKDRSLHPFLSIECRYFRFSLNQISYSLLALPPLPPSREVSEEKPVIKNDISSFREKECVICKDSVTEIMFCNCGHIVLCGECNAKYKLKECPVCRTVSETKRKLVYEKSNQFTASFLGILKDITVFTLASFLLFKYFF